MVDGISRKDGEIVRLHHSLQRMRTHLDAVDLAIRMCGPIGNEVAQGVASTALEVAMQIAKHDAYEMAEHDAKETPAKREERR